MSKPVTDYSRAIKRASSLEGQIRALHQRITLADRERELAERQVRDLTHELHLLRRENAQLRSLVPDHKAHHA